MVQEKGQKRRSFAEQLTEIKTDLDSRTVRVKWVVYEVTPGYNTGGYYDQDIPAEYHKVADELQSEQEAIDWIDRHEPDPGKRLEYSKKRLIRTVTEHWI
jgi:hypothetical protein